MKDFWRKQLFPGAISGLIATVLMTAWMGMAKAWGLVQTPPPKQITQNAQRQAGGRPSTTPREALHAGWLAAHLSYGMSAGAAYTLVRRFLPGNPVVAGLTYGGAFWALNYIGILPLLGL